MATQTGKVADDSVSKVDDEVSVGEDLEFQRKWWRFENGTWWFFGLILLLDMAGAFGRGPLAKAERRAADGSIDVKYERIERTGTPSFLSIAFGPAAVHDNQVKLFISESVVKELGTQRVVPAPLATQIGDGGLLYTFPASQRSPVVELGLQPSSPGRFHFFMQVPGSAPINAGVTVVP